MAGENGAAAVAPSSTIQWSPPRPHLDLSGAAIQGSTEDRNPVILLPNQSDELSHFAVDVGGSLIKLVYFSRHPDDTLQGKLTARGDLWKAANLPGLQGGFPILGGRLHFVKFETAKLNECLDFIQSKKLHHPNPNDPDGVDERSAANEGVTVKVVSIIPTVPSINQMNILGPYKLALLSFLAAFSVALTWVSCSLILCKATGGGAFKYADCFKERLGVTFDKEDEMDCLVAGANFLLRAIRYEAFTHMDGNKQFVQIDQTELYPYLLVNIGSGVSMIKVDGEGVSQRVSGTNVGGGTFWGLGRLLTKCKNFDEILELSQGVQNSAVDMLVGDIYGGLDYSKIGLKSTTIASSFGKVIAGDKDLEDYKREDIALSLLLMISYNIGQIAYLTALQYDLKRIFFGGFFIRGHAYTMDTMSSAIKYWSKGKAQAMFLRHEGFLGALGAFLSYDKPGLSTVTTHQFVERFPIGAPFAGGEIHGPPIRDLNEKISWLEKFVQMGVEITAPTPIRTTTGLGGFDRPRIKKVTLRSESSSTLNVGVLHFVPSLEPFPLLADPKGYEPNTVDLSDSSEREYWFSILSDNMPDLVEKAIASDGATDDSNRRGDAFSQAFRAHLARLREEPAAYGKLGLANLLELREECLREFHFFDAYRAVKQRENEASLAVLPDLLRELDGMDLADRVLALIEGVLAANIFDWGSNACVGLYHSGTIIEIYRMSRNKMQRPWRVDDFDAFKKRWIGNGEGAPQPKPHKRALLFVDNSGADVVLGMLPLARELLRRGTEVVLVANSLPAINDVTASELPAVVAAAAKHCDILRKSAKAGGLLVDALAPASNNGSHQEGDNHVPRLLAVASGSGSPCIDFRQVSSELAAQAQHADLVVLEGMGRSLHTNYNVKFNCEVLKLAMIKNQRLAEQLVNGSIYDCVCRYEPYPV